MPLLSMEPSLYPRDLFEEPPHLADETRWCVFHTRPRAEKALARLAVRHSVPFFLPLYTHRWRNQGRAFSSQLPLFPGYLFAYAEARGREVLCDRRYVANCLPVADQGRLWDDLRRVHRLIESGLSLKPEDRFAAGARVLITAGPFAGFEGTLLRSARAMTFMIEVEFIKRAVAVEIEEWMLEPLRQAPVD